VGQARGDIRPVPTHQAIGPTRRSLRAAAPHPLDSPSHTRTRTSEPVNTRWAVEPFRPGGPSTSARLLPDVRQASTSSPKGSSRLLSSPRTHHPEGRGNLWTACGSPRSPGIGAGFRSVSASSGTAGSASRNAAAACRRCRQWRASRHIVRRGSGVERRREWKEVTPCSE
jgi:hypothetical protein